MTQHIIKASAPGKIHFLGEHTAVYGKPAILAAIDKRCTIELRPTERTDVQITAKNFKQSVTVSYEEIHKITAKAQEQWEQYRATNDIALLKTIVAEDTMYPVIAIGETLQYCNVSPTKGFQLHIDSDIPMGSGHGSSAAVAASIAGAVATYLGARVTKDDISKIAIRVEQKKHGNPSYGDVGAVVNGGVIWFQKKTPEDILIKPLDFSVPEALSKNLLVIQSGIPEESTGEMVHLVADFRHKQPELLEQVLKDQEQLTYDLLEAIKSADEKELMRIIRSGEKNLETIGVVSLFAQTIIRDIEKIGGAAKICGAGGRRNGSGVILAYHKKREEIQRLAKINNLSYYTVQLGAKGVSVDI